MTLWCDNKAAIHIANNQVFHQRTKYVELDWHFIRDKVKEKVIALEYITSETHVADILTKVLSTSRRQQLKSKLRMVDIPS